MAAQVPPVADERESLIAYLDQQRDAFATVAFGLTEEQIRLAPTAGTLSIGGLIKHVTTCERGWTERMAAAPEAPAPPDRSLEEQATAWGDDFRVTDDDTLESLLAALAAQGDVTREVLRRADLGRRGARAPRRAVVPQGRRGVVGALGRDAPRRGARPPRGARRHRPRVDRRRDDVRARGRPRGVAGDAVAQALATGRDGRGLNARTLAATKAKGPWEYESQGPFWVIGRW